MPISLVTHGQCGTPTYHSWCSMLTRCNCPTATGYVRYGGRGITVCYRWHTFSNFLEDMGERPIGCSLDRIDNDMGYFPGNCKWSSAKEQANNKRPWKKTHTKGYTRTPSGKYVACIYHEGKRISLGTFATQDEAHHAHLDARPKYWLKEL